MKSLEERKADRIRRNEENAAVMGTSPREAVETGEADGKKGKAKKGEGISSLKEGGSADADPAWGGKK